MGFRFVRSIFGFIFLLLIQRSFSQERQLGTWKMFLPYGTGLVVCDAGDKVYAAASLSIFSYEKSTGSVQTYDKSSGLNDIGIKTMNYDPATKMLAIAYLNSNLDFIYNGTDVYNIPDIRNEAITGAISIYDISFYNGLAYVSSDLGISVIDLNLMQIDETYVIGSNGQQISVYGTSTDGVNLYAATSEGVKYAPLAASNLQDFNSWTLFGPAQNLPQRQASYIRVLNHKAYAVFPSSLQASRDTLYQFNGTTWTPIYDAAPDMVTSLNSVNGKIYFTAWDTVNSGVGWLGKIDSSGAVAVSSANNTLGSSRPVGWFESNGVIWCADAYTGLRSNSYGNVQNIVPDGPFRADAFGLNCTNGVLGVAPGGVDDSWDNELNRDGFYTYNGSEWDNYNQYSASTLNDGLLLDFLSVASIPARGKTYFGSFYGGIAELDNASKTIVLYNQYTNNSTLESSGAGNNNLTRISALTTDNAGNLWACNVGGQRPLKLLEADGHTWKDFTIPYSLFLMRRMLFDQNNQLWAPLRSGGLGLMVWTYNNTLDDPSDDKTVILNTGVGNGGLPSGDIHAIAQDLDGNIWVGTTAGIAVYYCPGSVFQGGCDATQIKVTLNGYVGYLFGMQSVRALAVDAANRVWVGTTEGVWLISNDGQTQYLNFTTENSPLPNNQITDIAINNITGEVFIATLGGLVSYQGDAVDTCPGCKKALVYPNPVKPDYTGPIAIKGLTDNAYVKITDVSGTLVYQGRANGTQMIWDGKGYTGSKAKSGVYLVFSSTDLGKERNVAKILISN